MDDFAKMLEIVERVEDRIEAGEVQLQAFYKELKKELASLSKWRWRIEGALFVGSGIISALVAIAIELVKK